MEDFTAPDLVAPSTLPAAFAAAALAGRPTREAGDAPRAVVVLMEIDVQGLAA